MATNLLKDVEKGIITVTQDDPAAPNAGDPVRLGTVVGIAIADEAAGGAGAAETVIDIGMRIWKLPVDDTGGGIAVGAKIYYHDTQTGTPATSLNDAATAADAEVGIALEVVAADATTTISVLVIPNIQ